MSQGFDAERHNSGFNPDISHEFGFGRPFCPAAAFSVKKVLTVLFKYAWRAFLTCGLAAGQNISPKTVFNRTVA
jgi:hypothetical protein